MKTYRMNLFFNNAHILTLDTLPDSVAAVFKYRDNIHQNIQTLDSSAYQRRRSVDRRATQQP